MEELRDGGEGGGEKRQFLICLRFPNFIEWTKKVSAAADNALQGSTFCYIKIYCRYVLA